MRPGPEVEVVSDAMAAILREKTEAERLEIGFAMWRSAWILIEANVRADNPGWTDDEVKHQVARRMLHGAI